MLRRVAKGSAAIVGASVAAIYVDAPKGDFDDGKYDGTLKPQVFPDIVHHIARLPVLTIPSAITKFCMTVLNNTKVEGAENLVAAAENRAPRQAIITVSNHTATIDDPVLLATTLPWKWLMPTTARWGLVSQEYGYTKGELTRLFFFAAKALPIKRGGGVDQPMLYHLFDKVQTGQWVHVYPEGKIEQNQILGGREEPRASEIGRLKWGTAKLIARADVRPVVVPIYSVNMQKMMPQNEHHKLISMMPKFGFDITLRVGKPINFDDIFDKYAADGQVLQSQAESWTTEEREKQLYSAITMRIEEALLDLAKDIYNGP